jgi:NADP-dependent 3-hydroxy acid dehydrogenase YdfG
VCLLGPTDGSLLLFGSNRRLRTLQETIAPLEARGCRLLALDVTDEGSMRRAVEEVERAEGAVGP